MNRPSVISAAALATILLTATATACAPDAPESQDEEPVTAAGQQAPAPLDSVRNFQVVDDRLASAGQIAYDQVPEIRERGYEVVVNLAIADEERNGREGFHVAEEGLAYVHIPVDWEEPQVSDVRMFFDVMEANRDRKVFVHCFANMRASAFVYLYRTLVEGVPDDEALATMHAIWDPAEDQQQWADLIEQVKAEYTAGG
ncbi:MAG: protein tyrosine phosphatase family protein [Gemmatimonadota bacterium]